MRVTERMREALEKNGYYDTSKYHYFISAREGNEYVCRYHVVRYENGYVRELGVSEKVCIWKH